ncbi:hypothetical protein BT93_F0386 [Corymbia citriodora subsp. variegata]|nr:hypothetical protein BT93_F0386 [Corymbia citriodora subsp. variegata]
METELKHAAMIDTKLPRPGLEEKFAPFVRRDMYGPSERGDPPLAEKVLLGLALVTIVPARVVVAVNMALFYYSICRVCTLGVEPRREDDQEDYALREVLGGRCGPRILKSSDDENFGVAQLEENERPGAIISNHLSYIDILYHMSSSFPSFVAKRSVAKLPIVGLVSKCLGCIYVQRESKALDFRGVAGIVARRAHEAHLNKDAPMVMLFPEGTTTNGDFLLPFKTGAFLSNTPVLPVILRYPYERFGPAWDSISGVRHFIFLLCQLVNHLEVTYLRLYYPSKQENDDPKLYADNIRR